MKKTIFILLCLTIISMGIASVSASDNGTMTDASIQTIDQQHISVDNNMTNENYLNYISVQVDNNTTSNSENSAINVDNVTVDDFKPVEKTAELNITGPKKDGGLKINGPKLPSNGPKIEFTKMEKDIFHFAKIFKENLDWTPYGCMYYFLKNTDSTHYTWKQVALIIARAHNIAVDHSPHWWNSGKGWYKTNLTSDEVYYELMQNAWFFKKTMDCPTE